MKRIPVYLSLLLIFALLLSACSTPGEEENGELAPTGVTGGELATLPGTDTGGLGGPAGTEMPQPTEDLEEPVATTTPEEIARETVETGTQEPAATTGPEIPDTGAATVNRLTNLIDLDVQNMDGETAASIEDFVVDLQNERICYALLGVGGILGIGVERVAVPYQTLTVSSGLDQSSFVLNVDPSLLENAPTFDQDTVDFTSTGWDASVFDYWSTQSGVEIGEMVPCGQAAAGGSDDQSGASATTTPDAEPTDAGGAAATGAPGGSGETATGTPGAAGPATTTQEAGAAAQSGQTVLLASNLLNANVAVGQMAGQPGGDLPEGGAATTGTPAGDVATNQGVGQVLGMVADVLVESSVGEICYVALDMDEAALDAAAQTGVESGSGAAATGTPGGEAVGSGQESESACARVSTTGTDQPGTGGETETDGTGTPGGQDALTETGTPDGGAAETGTPAGVDVTAAPGAGWSLVPARALTWDAASNTLYLGFTLDTLNGVPQATPDSFMDVWEAINAYWEDMDVTR